MCQKTGSLLRLDPLEKFSVMKHFKSSNCRGGESCPDTALQVCVQSSIRRLLQRIYNKPPSNLFLLTTVMRFKLNSNTNLHQFFKKCSEEILVLVKLFPRYYILVIKFYKRKVQTSNIFLFDFSVFFPDIVVTEGKGWSCKNLVWIFVHLSISSILY